VRRATIPLILLACVACSPSTKPISGAAGASGGAGGAIAGAGASGAAGTGGGGAAGASHEAGSAGSAAAGSGGAGGGGGVAGGGSGGTAGGAISGAGGSSTDAGSDAGPGGGRDFSTDRAAFFGASRCAQANVQLCEDFESGTLDTATWTTIGGPKPVIDGVQKARGNKALHLTIMGSGQSAIRESKTFPAPNNTYYGRAFVYFASLPTPMTGFTYSHWTMIAATGSQVSGEVRVSGQMQNGMSYWGVGTDNRVDPNGTGDWTNSDNDPSGKPAPVPVGQWLCIEWMHKGDTNETRFWWDGVEHPSLHTTPTTPHGGNPTEPFILPQFKNVWLGWAEYQPTMEPFELWLDEIAIDKDRIGCVL
jgi:hypothetical protein